MKINDIWKKVKEMFLRKNKSNLKFIDGNTELHISKIPLNQIPYGEKPDLESVPENNISSQPSEMSEESWNRWKVIIDEEKQNEERRKERQKKC